MLYDTGKENANIDSLPYLSLPDYITMTDDKGKFVFRALSDKNYLLFALKDGNSNMLYDLPNENIAFYPEYVRPVYIPDKLFNIPKTLLLLQKQKKTCKTASLTFMLTPL